MCVHCTNIMTLDDGPMVEAFRKQEAWLKRFETQLAEQERAWEARKLQPKHRASLCGRTVRLTKTLGILQ